MAIQPIRQGSSIGAWQDGFTRTFAEGTSQTWVAGAPLKFSSGKVVIISSVTTPVIAGIAMAAATGTAASQASPGTKVIMPLTNVLLEVSVDTTTTSGTAALATGKPSDFNVGTSYELLLDVTSGNYYMGTGTGNPVFQLIEYDPGQASVVQGRVLVRVLQSQTSWT